MSKLLETPYMMLRHRDPIVVSDLSYLLDMLQQLSCSLSDLIAFCLLSRQTVSGLNGLSTGPERYDKTGTDSSVGTGH